MTDPTSILLFYVCLFFEVSIEPELSQRAAAHAIMNRAKWNYDNIADVVLEPRKFSWTLDKAKMDEARKIIRTGVLPKRMNTIRRKAKVWVTERHKEPFTHWQGKAQIYEEKKPTWTCYRGGDTTRIFEGSNHIYCGDKDVVRPGRKPKYIIERLARRSVMRIWMKNRQRLNDDSVENDC